MKRRKRYYYEIHLNGGFIETGTALWSGMIEAEKEVSDKALEVMKQRGRGLRGFLIREKRRGVIHQ